MNSITCYGGVNTIGGNKVLLELADSSIFLDFGLNFGEEGRFFEEYLQPRSNSKFHDLLKLNLLPEIDGIYRKDAMQPEGLREIEECPSKPLWECDLKSYEEAKSNDEWTPDAIFVSHAHLDHCGYVPYLGDMPLVCSTTTSQLMEAIKDIGNLTGFDGDLVDIERRYIDRYGSRAYFPEEPKIETMEGEKREKKLLENRQRTDIGEDIELEAVKVDHSVPGALSALIESKDKQIVYTGDLRFHGRSTTDLHNYLEGLKPDLMLCEGTRIEEEEPDDEEQVERKLSEEISDADGLVMVGFAWKDLDRYETVKRAAEKEGRTPVFDPRLAYLKARLGESIYEDGAKVFVERSDSMLYSCGDYTRAKHKAGDRPVSEWNNKDDIKDTTHLEKGVTAVDIKEKPEEYVLQLDYYRFKNIVDLDPPKGSIYVRAQSEPFNEEMKLSEERLMNWLEHFDINEEKDHEPIQIHASGHACGPELQEMIDAIKPKRLVPIHTLKPEMFENENGDIVIPHKGKTISF